MKICICVALILFMCGASDGDNQNASPGKSDDSSPQTNDNTTISSIASMTSNSPFSDLLGKNVFGNILKQLMPAASNQTAMPELIKMLQTILSPNAKNGNQLSILGIIQQLLGKANLKMPPELQKLISSLMAATDENNSNWLPICYAIKNQTQSIKASMSGAIGDLAAAVCFKIATQKNDSTVIGPSKSQQWSRCEREMSRMYTGLVAGETWAMTMFDAMGKPESGILKGNFHFRGNNRECQEVSFKDPTNLLQIEGNMCFVSLSIPQLQSRVFWNVCLPKSCLDGDLNLVLSDFLSFYPTKPMVACTKDLDMSNDKAAIIAIVILVMFGVLMVTGTLIELFINYNKTRLTAEITQTSLDGTRKINKGFELGETMAKNETNYVEPVRIVDGMECNNGIKKNPTEASEVVSVPRNQEQSIDDLVPFLPTWQRVFLAFSIPRNAEKILSVKSTSGSIGCLHGIRVLSMAWVILGHIILVYRNTIKNPKDLLEATQTMAFQLIGNAFFSVDTFFLLSGTLTCYVFLKKLSKKGTITIKEFIMYYVHRYWRLTPSMMMWIMIVATLMQYIGEGSNSWGDFMTAQTCRDNWWTNLIYINNVYKIKESCIGVTWYLANDMQFYVVAPLALIPWLYGSKGGFRSRVYTLLGFVVCLVYVGIHLASTLWLEYGIKGNPMRISEEEQDKIYYKPYTRVAPYAIGLMLGWMLWKSKCKAKMNKGVVFCGWVFSLGLILVLTLVTYDQTKSAWPHLGRVVEKGLSRPLWAVAVSWIIWACATGHGGYINSMLSWNGWLPTSRLTYSAFLVHLTIMFFNLQTMEYTIMYTAASMSYLLFGYFVMSYVIGFILTVSVESPMIALEKIVFK